MDLFFLQPVWFKSRTDAQKRTTTKSMHTPGLDIRIESFRRSKEEKTLHVFFEKMGFPSIVPF